MKGKDRIKIGKDRELLVLRFKKNVYQVRRMGK